VQVAAGSGVGESTVSDRVNESELQSVSVCAVTVPLCEGVRREKGQ